ncbi:MAG TPA: hypothetical protein PLP11_00970, partial [Bacteroidales bacterium]|nr:hypothetical protein [Bacteroidales bacterium]
KPDLCAGFFKKFYRTTVITNKFHDARNVALWVKKGWHVILAYVVGFFALFLILGWEPASNKEHTEPAIDCKAADCPVREKALELKKHKIEEQKKMILRKVL